MRRFWAMAARRWPFAAPAHQLVAAIGQDHVHLLETSGIVDAVALRPHDTVPCSTCRRSARVIYEPGGAVAICTGPDECPDEELGPTPARLVLSTGPLAAKLAGALELDGQPGAPGAVTPLGARRIGDELVAFYLCPSPRHRDTVPALAPLADGGPEVGVMLVPDARTIPADMPAKIGGVSLVWAGLDEVLTVGPRLVADLGPVLSRRAFRGVVYERPFDGLTFAAEGVLWHGRLVVPVARGVAVQLLRVLAGRPGEWSTRRELWWRLWPEEHTRDGDLPRGANPERFDARLRVAINEARAALRTVGLDGVVENQRGSDDEGGYRLALRREQVRLPIAA
jgi:hypothetical protein